MKGNAPQLTDLKSDAKGVPLTGATMAEVLQNVNEKSEWMPGIVEESAGESSSSVRNLAAEHTLSVEKFWRRRLRLL